LQARVEDARRTLGLVHKQLRTFGDQIAVFRSMPMSKGKLDLYFDSLLGTAQPGASSREQSNRSKALEKLCFNFFDERNTLSGMRGSLWAALNAATEFADHQRCFRGPNDLARKESRLDSIWFGASNDFKQSAYRSALQLVGLN
jgi:hypothetical protein